jgi:hypothetical protein
MRRGGNRGKERGGAPPITSAGSVLPAQPLGVLLVALEGGAEASQRSGQLEGSNPRGAFQRRHGARRAQGQDITTGRRGGLGRARGEARSAEGGRGSALSGESFDGR